MQFLWYKALAEGTSVKFSVDCFYFTITDIIYNNLPRFYFLWQITIILSLYRGSLVDSTYILLGVSIICKYAL